MCCWWDVSMISITILNFFPENTSRSAASSLISNSKSLVFRNSTIISIQIAHSAPEEWLLWIRPVVYLATYPTTIIGQSSSIGELTTMVCKQPSCPADCFPAADRKRHSASELDAVVHKTGQFLLNPSKSVAIRVCHDTEFHRLASCAKQCFLLSILNLLQISFMGQPCVPVLWEKEESFSTFWMPGLIL